MSITKLSIKAMRNQLADVVARAELSGEFFIITKFGKPKAAVVPLSFLKVENGERQAGLIQALSASSGIWKHRRDMRDSAKWVTAQRESRNG